MNELFKKTFFLAFFYSLINQAQSYEVLAIYTVKSGDEVMIISNKFYNTHHAWQEIMMVNNGVTPDSLSVGQEIIIPRLTQSDIQNLPKNVRDRFKMDPLGQWEIKQAEEQTSLLKKVITKNYIPKKTAQNDKNEEAKEKSAQTIESTEERLKLCTSQFKQAKENEKSKDDENISLQKKLTKALEKSTMLFKNNQNLKDKLKEQEIKYLEEKRTLAKIKREGGSPKWLAKYRKLQKRFFQVKADYQKVKIQQNNHKRNKGMTKLSQQERKNLENQIIELKDKLAKSKIQRKILEEKLPYYMPTQIANSQEQVLKEKNRILAHRFWIEKNKNIGKCEITFPDEMSQSKDQYQELITFLNAQFGRDKIFIDSQSNSIIAHIPGEAIYGVDEPNVRSSYDKKFKNINQFLEQLPVEGITITGQSKTDSVKSEKGHKVSGNYFILKQSLRMRDFFINELGIAPALIESNSVGHDLEKSPEKKFIVKFDFKDMKQIGRAPASIVETDKALQTIGTDILKELYEPKYSQINITNSGLSIDLGRHYFFKDGSRVLTVEGKQKIDKIMKMFALVTDSKFHFTWFPGLLEKNDDENKRLALRQMSIIKKYVDEKFDWSKGKVTVGFKSRFNKQRMAYSNSEDRYNRRISFSIQPISISAQAAGEPVLK